MDHPVRRLRLHLGLSVAALAGQIHRSRQFVDQVESGVSRLGPDSLLAICDLWGSELEALDLRVEDLLRPEKGEQTA